MKNVYKLTLLASILIMLGGCTRFLNEQPLTQVPTEDFFTSVGNITSAVAGIYASFQVEMAGDGISAYGGKYHYWGECRSDNFDRSQYSNTIMDELSINALSSTNTTTSWEGLYRTIGRTNYCLKYIPQVPKYDVNATSIIVNNNLAQCYAMRAMCYFYIVRLWGDAPIYTEPYTDITQQAARARAPKSQVLDSIVSDLTNAYRLIQKSQTPSVWTINEGAICAMMADVYMWKSDYVNAKIWFANLFLAKAPSGKVYTGATGAGGDLEATVDWKTNLFLNPAASKEAIWSISWSATDNGCACIPVSIALNNNPVKIDTVIWAAWKLAFNRTDKRVTQTIDTLSGLNHWDKLRKYYTINTAGTTILTTAPLSVPYLVMYRLGDMYLLYAEALNQTGDLVNALKYLNFVHQRAGIPAYAATDVAVSNQSVMQDAILLERQYELFGEGKRWFDLVRNGKVNTIMDPVTSRRERVLATSETGFGIDQNKILWPINRNVLEYNKLLVQNPSY